MLSNSLNYLLPASVKEACENILNTSIDLIAPVSGGDINEARLLSTNKGPFFLKINQQPWAADLFFQEAIGLKTLSETKAIFIPEVIAHDKTDDGHAFLLLPYLEPKSPSKLFWQNFGQSLATLHQNSHRHFGFENTNYIGSLKQSNEWHDRWSDFFIQERLEPQLQLARKQGLLDLSVSKKFENLFLKLPQLFPEERPALTHGDLWSGNFLCLGDHAALIDPAVSYAHREIDIAMSQLFGGFNPSFYDAYQEVYPMEKGFENRMDIYQLYYLMVHVNLFGQSYLRTVQTILNRYS